MTDAFGNDHLALLPEVEVLRREVDRLRTMATRERMLSDAIFRQSTQGTIVFDSQGRPIQQNAAAGSIWAGSAPAATVADWDRYRAFHADKRPFEPGDWSIARCLAGRRAIGAEELGIQRLDGSFGILLGTALPLIAEDGELEGGVWVFADITRFKGAGERLRAMTNALPVLVSFVGADERYELCNDTYERWYGLAPSDVLGRRVRDVVGAKSFAEIEGYVRRAIAGESVRFEARVDYPRAGIRWIEASYVSERRADGSVAGFIALVTDITARKDLEASREAVSERLRLLAAASRRFAEAASDLPTLLEAIAEETAASLGDFAEVGLVDPDSGRLDSAAHHADPEVRRAHDRLLARAPGEAAAGIIGRVLTGGEPLLAPAIDRAWLDAHVGPERAAWMEELGARSLVAAPLRANGRVIGAISCCRSAPHAAHTADDLRFLESVADRAAIAIENALLLAQIDRARSQNELLYRLTDAINRVPSVEDLFVPALDTTEKLLAVNRLGILLTDVDGVLRLRAWRGLSEDFRAVVERGFPWRQLADEPLVVADATAEPSLAAHHGALEAESIRGLALIPLAHEGRLLGQFMVCSSEPRAFTDAEVRIARTIAFQVGSVVGRMQAQRDRERLVGELGRALNLSEMFSAILGHDLRNPLFAIINTAESSLRRGPDEEAARRFNRIISSGRRMNRMIDQLLDFTRVRLEGRMPVSPAATDAALVFRDAIEEIATERPDCRIELERAGDTRGVWDADRLAQLASNLLGNAVRHGTPGRVVRVMVDGRLGPQLVCSIHNEGHVPAEILPHVFDPFRRGDDRRTSEGLGLGLYIAQQIVLAHEGTIEIRSTPEAGTTVTFTLRR